MKRLTKKQVRVFQEKVYEYYDQHKRSFPWRRTTNPYRIFISELMLQQTQAERVVDYYKNFLKTFPTVHVLAESSLGEVLTVWQGLGYNRRAKFLHLAAQAVVTDHKGTFPKTYEGLQTLPGIGPYTAAAITTFSYNEPLVVIETNIRAVFIHEFLKDSANVDDNDILPLIEQTIDRGDPRKWYNALMDYGSMLKKEHPNPSRKSKHHTKQSKFKGSHREVRGAIIKLLTEDYNISKGITKKALCADLPFEHGKIEHNLAALLKEGMIAKYKGKYQLT